MTKRLGAMSAKGLGVKKLFFGRRDEIFIREVTLRRNNDSPTFLPIQLLRGRSQPPSFHTAWVNSGRNHTQRIMTGPTEIRRRPCLNLQSLQSGPPPKPP